jgi:integrase
MSTFTGGGHGLRSAQGDRERSLADRQWFLMPRERRGQITEKTWADGETISYRGRVYAYGRREFITFGTSAQGWNRMRAELELERILQQIERGTWIPPRVQAREDRAAAAMARLGVRADEPFRVFARRWWNSKRLHVETATINDYEWRLNYLNRFFGRYHLSEIDVALVDRFRDELAEQADTIRAAAARGRPLIESVTDVRGRIYERRRRALSNTSINAMIGLLGQMLQQAVDHELIARNPVRIGGRSGRFLPRSKPSRTFLEIDEFHSLIDGANELDVEARQEYQGIGRRAMLAGLALSGLRIGELLDLLVAHVDFVRQRLRVADAKTEAGVREVEMTLFLRDELLAYFLGRKQRGLPCAADDYFFGTNSGKRRDPNRFRDRILSRAVDRADTNRAKNGLPPLPPITPHSLRRTWATFAAIAGRHPRWIAAQIGHTNPVLTFQVYEQVATRRFLDEEAIWNVMRFADEPDERAPGRQLTRETDARAGGWTSA